MTAEEYLKGNSFSEFDPELNGKSTCVELITALTAVEMAKREERERLMKYMIDKSALVAEIKKHLEYANNGILYAQTGIEKGLKKYERELNAWQHCQSMCKNILSFLDTLEVKEVDKEPVSENLWKDAQGDDLPEIDREVIVLCKNGRVAFGHRPVEKFITSPIGYGRTKEYEVKTYDKGGWNMPNVMYWLDVCLPKEVMEESV